MKFDTSDWTLASVLASLFVVVVLGVAGTVAESAWRSTERAAAFKAYTDCLNAMKGQPIDVQQMFCGKIKDQL